MTGAELVANNWVSGVANCVPEIGIISLVISHKSDTLNSCRFTIFKANIFSLSCGLIISALFGATVLKFLPDIWETILIKSL